MSAIVHEFINAKDQSSIARLDKQVVHSYPTARVTLRLDDVTGVSGRIVTVTIDDIRAATKQNPPQTTLDYIAKREKTSVAALSKLPVNQDLISARATTGLQEGDQLTVATATQLSQGVYTDFLDAFITNLSVNMGVGSQGTFTLSLVGWHNVSLLSPVYIYLRGRPYDTFINRNIRTGETDDFNKNKAILTNALLERKSQALEDLAAQRDYIVAVDGEQEFLAQQLKITNFYDQALVQLEQTMPSNVEQASTGNFVRVFWGVVNSVTKDYSNGSQTTNVSGADISYWWARTDVVTQVSIDVKKGGTAAAGREASSSRFAKMTVKRILTKLLSPLVFTEFAITNQNMDVSIYTPSKQLSTSVASLPEPSTKLVDEWFNKVNGAFQQLDISVGKEVANLLPFDLDASVPDAYQPQFKDVFSMIQDIAGAVNAEFFLDMVGPTEQIQRDGSVKNILARLVLRKPLYAQTETISAIEGLYSVYSSSNAKKIVSVAVLKDEALEAFAARNNTTIDSLRTLNASLNTSGAGGQSVQNIASPNPTVLSRGQTRVSSLKIGRGEDDSSVILNEVYKIDDIDVISFSESLNAAGCVSSVSATGSWHIKTSGATSVAPFFNVIATNKQLLRRFGYKPAQITILGITNRETIRQYAVDWLTIMNAQNMHTANLTIVGRPLIKLGTFVKVSNSYWYVNSISHAYTPKGQFQTSLGLIAGYISPAKGDSGTIVLDENDVQIGKTVDLILDRFANLEQSESAFISQGVVKKLGSVITFGSNGLANVTNIEPTQEKTVIKP